MIVSQSISFYGNNHCNIPMILTKPSVDHDTCIVMLHGTCSNKNETGYNGKKNSAKAFLYRID